MAGDYDDISEIPEYSPKSEFSKARLCEMAVNKCIEARGSEMKEGYFNIKLTKEGQPIKTWVPDSREKFFGCVEALKSLLSPEIKRDKIIKENIESFEEEIERLKDLFGYEEFKIISDEGVVKFKKSGIKYIPPIDAKVIIETFDLRLRKNVGKEIVGGWNTQVNTYKNELIEVYDFLFSKLSDLIDRNNYFKSGMRF